MFLVTFRSLSGTNEERYVVPASSKDEAEQIACDAKAMHNISPFSQMSVEEIYPEDGLYWVSGIYTNE